VVNTIGIIAVVGGLFIGAFIVGGLIARGIWRSKNEEGSASRTAERPGAGASSRPARAAAPAPAGTGAPVGQAGRLVVVTIIAVSAVTGIGYVTKRVLVETGDTGALPSAQLLVTGEEVYRTEIENNQDGVAWSIYRGNELYRAIGAREKSIDLSVYPAGVYNVVLQIDIGQPTDADYSLVSVSNEVQVVVGGAADDQTTPSSPAATNTRCAWAERLTGTWYYKHADRTDYYQFEPGGTGYYWQIDDDGNRSHDNTWQWDCTDDGKFKSLNTGSEFTVSVDDDVFVINGDRWRRGSPDNASPAQTEDGAEPPGSQSVCPWSDLIVGVWRSTNRHTITYHVYRADGTIEHWDDKDSPREYYSGNRWECADNGQLYWPEAPESVDVTVRSDDRLDLYFVAGAGSEQRPILERIDSIP